MLVYDDTTAAKVEKRINTLLVDPSPVAADDAIKAIDSAPEQYRHEAIRRLEMAVRGADTASQYVVNTLIALRRA